MRVIALILCICLGVLLFAASADFPNWGDPKSPANHNVSPYYIKNAYKETKTPNLVSAVLGDYRSFDTLLETTVVLLASIAIIFLIRRSTYTLDYRPEEEVVPPHRNLILVTVCRYLIPVMELFAIYVLIHGHHSPGGGFQGGVILGATLILNSLVFGLRHTLRFFSVIKRKICIYGGVIIYLSVGLLCMLCGGTFLDYSSLSVILPVEPAMARSLGILFVETGVALTVMTALFVIYIDLSSSGELDRGI